MISKDQLKQVLVEQKEAILRRPLGVRRTALRLIQKKAKLPHVIVLTGIRRSGKSTLLRQVMHTIYSDTGFYYINFEDERLFNFQAKDFNNIYETLIELFGEQKTFFIDEIQNVASFEQFVRRFYDLGFKFYITGSSAQLLSKEIGTKLTGRHVDVAIWPFTFQEYLAAKEYKLSKKALFKTTTRVTVKKHFSNYLQEGGMPEYIRYKDPEILTRVYEDIVIKDVVARYGVENQKQIKELYQYLITTTAQKFNYSSLKKLLSIQSANTIKKFIDYLEETYFMNIVNKFDYSLQKQIKNDKKAYVIDNGFISKISTTYSKDNGWLLENLVHNTLQKKGTVFYYSGRQECDFILVKNNRIKEAIQVSWNIHSANREREVNGLLEAMDAFKLKKGLILTGDQEEEIIHKRKRILVKPVWKWLLE